MKLSLPWYLTNYSEGLHTYYYILITAIEHFHAELRQTNCCVTRRLSVGITQARCSCCLLVRM